jgi:beta-glucosidase
MNIPEIIEQRVAALLASMTLSEKIGQMSQVNASEGYAPDYLADGLREGRIGSVLNVVDVSIVNELQRINLESCRCETRRTYRGSGGSDVWSQLDIRSND